MSEEIKKKEAPQEAGKLSIYLRISVFLAGMGIMSAEMAAPRLLAPSFGTTQLIWTNIIGTVLAAMTIGAFIGGKLSDKWPTEKAYARVLVLAGFLLFLVPLISSPILTGAVKAMDTQDGGILIFSLLAVCFFFAPPIFLMGMISPWAVKLAGSDSKDLGRRAGILSALSAAGSIIGTFGSSLFALPLLGTRKTLLITGGLLIATGIFKAFGLGKKSSSTISAVMILILLLLPKGAIKADKGQLYEAESPYHYVQVIGSGSHWRALRLNEGWSTHSIYSKFDKLTGSYWDFISVLPTLNTNKGEDLNVLILGLAGGTMAMQIDKYYGHLRNVHIDGVEIDPGVIKAGKLFFDLDTISSLDIHITDARTYLLTAKKKYDLIFADAYRHPYIPFHMVTKEFYKKCADLLADDGIFAINLGTHSKYGTELVDAFAITMKEAFNFIGLSTSNESASGVKNFIFMASQKKFNLNETPGLPDILKFRVLPQMKNTWSIPDPPVDSVLFTDDKSPIEYFTERAILLSILKKL